LGGEILVSATRELINVLVSSGMDAVDAASLVARAGAEMSVGPSKAALRTRRWREGRASPNVTSDAGEIVNERHKPSPRDGAQLASQTVTNRHKTSQTVTCDGAEKKASLSVNKKEENKKEKRERASRLANDWQPTPQDWSTACAMLGQKRADAELLNFRDHWKQAPDKTGLKLDWHAAWRLWTRRSHEWGSRNDHSRQTRTATTTRSTQTHGDATLAGLGRIADRVRERGLAERQANLTAAGGDDLVGQRSRDGVEPCLALIEAPRPDADHERDFGS
jgi:hypothetical protein